MSRTRKILSGVLVLLLIGGGYIGWTFYHGKRVADSYTKDAEKIAEEIASQSIPDLSTAQIDNSNSPTENPTASPNTSSTGDVAPADNNSQPAENSDQTAKEPTSNNNTATNSSTKTSPTSQQPQTAPKVDYKKLMTPTYNKTIKAMSNVVDNTYALKDRKISVETFKSRILQSQATFASAQAYVQANPPKDSTLTSSYKEFLTGIALANYSMNVVLKGISSKDTSYLYAAKDLGEKAYTHVTNGYKNF